MTLWSIVVDVKSANSGSDDKIVTPMFMVCRTEMPALILFRLSSSTLSGLLLLIPLPSLIAGVETMGPHHEAFASNFSRAD
jgi:hypothetical protein